MRAASWIWALVSALGVLTPAAAQDRTAPNHTEQRASAERSFHRGAPLPSWAQTLAEVPATQSTDAVVVRVAETQFYTGHPSATLVSRALKAQTSAAVASIGQVPLSFVPEYQALLLHQVRIERQGLWHDRLASTQVRFLEREPDLDSGIYSGAVTAMLLLDDVRVGDTLHVVFTITGRNPVLGPKFSDSASWDSGDRIELRRVTVLSPPGKTIQWKVHGDPQRAPLEPINFSTETGLKGLRFEDRGLAAIESEPATPADYFALRWIQLTEFEHWSEVSAWAQDLFQRPKQLPAALRPVIQRIRQQPMPEARVVAALKWVQEEIRYFSVSMGESSHRPYPPEQVVSRRYGDCKDKTLLLVSMLHELGIHADPVLVSVHAGQTALRTLPTADLFDHAIVRVQLGEKHWYLDPTRQAQGSTLDHIQHGLYAHAGLVIAPQTRAPTRIQSSTEQKVSHQFLREHFRVKNPQEDVELVTSREYTGLAADELRASLDGAREAQLRKWVMRDYERRYPGLVLQGTPTLHDEPATNTLKIEARFRVPQGVSAIQGEWVLKYFPSTLAGIVQLPKNVERQFPATISEPSFSSQYELTVDWPTGVKVEDPLELRRVESPFFDAKIERFSRGSTSVLRISYQSLAHVAQPKELPTLLANLQTLEQRVGSHVLATAPRSPADLQDPIEARLLKALSQLSSTIASGRLAPEELAHAHCERSKTHLLLGRVELGLNDAEEAVGIAPEQGFSWRCRADAALATGRFAQAIADYGKALAYGHEVLANYHRRGVAYFYAGNYAKAERDFGQVLAGAKKDESSKSVLLSAQLWHIWTLSRTGQTPRALSELSPTHKASLRMALGEMSPEEWLQSPEIAQSRTPESVAWFHIAQKHFLAGETREAKIALEKGRVKNLQITAEQLAAQYETSRLGSTTSN